MNQHEALAAKLTTLQAEATRIRDEGEYLQGVRLERAAAGGTASASSQNSYKYARLRCGKGKALPNGSKSKYIPLKEIPQYEGAIARGKKLAAVEREIERLQRLLNRSSKQAAKLDLES